MPTPTSDQKKSLGQAEAERLKRYFDYDAATATWAERVSLGGTGGAAGAQGGFIGAVGGKLAVVTQEFTRPANVTAYAAKDVVGTDPGTNLTFAGAARVDAGSGYITKAQLMTDLDSVVARLRLHLFTVVPTVIVDNIAASILWADRAKRIGYIDFPAMQTEDAAASDAANSLNAIDRLPFVCAAATTSLFGVLETLDAFVPASGQKFFVSLTFDQN